MLINKTLSKVSVITVTGSLLMGCVAMVDRLVPQASINEKKYDFLADIELQYAGNTIRARRHFEYFLFRNFNQNGKEISREFASQRVGYIKISDTDATSVVISPELPLFVGSITWSVKIGRIYRMQLNDRGEMRCILLGDGSSLVTAKPATLTRLPTRSGGYPDDRSRFHFGEPPYSSKDCRAYLDAGSVDETITRD